jgi:hypothetical protein
VKTDPSFDDLNTIAWRDFLTWAWNEPEMRAQFTAKTGVEIQSVTSPINAAIDAATGARTSIAARFIEWATREHWGVEHAPAAYQQVIADKATST